MQNYSRVSNAAQKWEDEITGWLQELKLHGHEMSPYEQNVIRRRIRQRQDELIPQVGPRVVGEFRNAIKRYQQAEKEIRAERAKEIDRFDAAKLNADLQLLQSRVDIVMKRGADPLRGDSVAKKLQQLFDENVQSNDIHKQRAAIEIFKGLSIDGPERIEVNDLARKAERIETEFRQTDGTRSAQQSRIDALGELHQTHDALEKTSQLLGLGAVDDVFAASPFAKASRMVEFTDEGPVIRDENDPAVTGVHWHSKQG